MESREFTLNESLRTVASEKRKVLKLSALPTIDIRLFYYLAALC
jgi:hypothetical protein